MALFNVRVYGVLIHQARLLVSDEFIRGEYFTKLPGGGLEFGEGTRDCLKREFNEETGLDVQVGDHLYTTDFFQISAFNKKDQIISIYYTVHTENPLDLPTVNKPFDFQPHQIADPNGEAEVFRWIPLTALTEKDMSLPIDRVVIRLLLDKYR
ncbi:MAG TPA: NUDIX domain-containing protein [Sediminibacterium sp.]|nr:NUDIX domain-containing protein [Sediminibacterium sp.]